MLEKTFVPARELVGAIVKMGLLTRGLNMRVRLEEAARIGAPPGQRVTPVTGEPKL